MQEIKNAAVPYNTVGLLEVKWTPLGGPGEDDGSSPLTEIVEESDLIGKKWTYKLDIVQASDLPVFCEMAYVEYDFFGETFTTEAVQQTTFSPRFEYSRVHHISNAKEDFLVMLKGALEMRVHVTQHITAPPDKLGTSNSIVVESIRSGEPKGYEAGGVDKPKSELELKNVQLTDALQKLQEENTLLQQRIRELELRLLNFEGDAKSLVAGSQPLSARRAELDRAKLKDGVINS